MPTTPRAIEASGLVIRYGARAAVDGLDLAVERGQVVALLGRNGAGKTSTVEALEGYRKRAAGTVRVLGLDPEVAAERKLLNRRIGVMLQGGGVYPSINPAEALALFASYYDDPLPARDLLDRLDLASVMTTPWRRLSGGEQQRLSMALALIGRPEVAFLDEPTAGVDPSGRICIRGEIERLRAEGAGVLLTTHELQEAERLADRIVIIDGGRVVAEGTLSELAAGEPAAIRFRAGAGLDRADLGRHLGAPVAEPAPGEYRVDAPGDPDTVARLTRWLAERQVSLSDLRTTSRLEEIFLRLTGGGSQ